jgi:cell division protein FtsB
MQCPSCGRQVGDDDQYCAKCGQSLKAAPEALREIVRSELERELSSKYKDQKFVAVETAESVAERLEKWGKWFFVFAAVPTAILLAVLAVVGVTSYLDAIKKIEIAKQKADSLTKTNEEIDAETKKARSDLESFKRELGSIRSDLRASVQATISDLRAQTEETRRLVAPLKGRVDLLSANITDADVTSVTAVNAAMAKAFASNDLSKVVTFLKAMGAPVDETSSKDKVESELRSLGGKIGTDAALRKKYFEEAKKAGLIQ